MCVCVYIYIYRERERERGGDLALNNLKWLIYHKTKPNHYLLWNVKYNLLTFT